MYPSVLRNDAAYVQIRYVWNKFIEDVQIQ
jgi:hypothetical protein